MSATPAARPDKAAVNLTIDYHARISRAMTAERTALGSALIPVTPYIIVSCIECYRRYPALMDAVRAVADPASIGRTGRRPGSQVDPVHLWSIVNLPLLGRQVLAPFGLIDPADDLDRTATVLAFWEEAALAFRGDGHRQSWDAGFVTPRYDADVLEELTGSLTPIDASAEGASRRSTLMRVNAALTSFIFLLYFDTRAGYQDTGPYPLGDGRTLLVRDFNELGVSHFAWSADVCREMPYQNLTFALVLRDVAVRCNDWGTTTTDPLDYFAHVEAVGVFDPTGGRLAPVPFTELAGLTEVVKRAQKDLYRLIAAMTRDEKIAAGAYVYFTFLRPFALAAGLEHQLDWSCPRDSLDLYDMVAAIDETPEVDANDPMPYYWPVA